MRVLIGLVLLWTTVSCDNTLTDAQEIIDRAIAAAGGNRYTHSTIAFDFRNRHYIARREGGRFSYERIFDDTAGTVHDFVTNEGFRREINGRAVEVPDSLAARYAASTNSVLYFALLPYGLNDASVKKQLLGTVTWDGKEYYHVEVTFMADGGGEDFEDVYHYWISRDDFSIGYLAYSFSERDETSFRFRQAYHQRTVNGITFYDYRNFKPSAPDQLLPEAGRLFQEGKLEQLSVIELTQIRVQ